MFSILKCYRFTNTTHSISIKPSAKNVLVLMLDYSDLSLYSRCWCHLTVFHFLHQNPLFINSTFNTRLWDSEFRTNLTVIMLEEAIPNSQDIPNRKLLNIYIFQRNIVKDIFCPVHWLIPDPVHRCGYINYSQELIHLFRCWDISLSKAVLIKPDSLLCCFSLQANITTGT